MPLTLGPLTKRVTYWQKIMNLGHWDIEVKLIDRFEHNAACLASCWADANYDRATLTFIKTLVEESETPDPLDLTIVHELLHIHGRDLEEVLQGALGSLGEPERDAIRGRWTHEDEGFVYRVSNIIVNLNK